MTATRRRGALWGVGMAVVGVAVVVAVAALAYRLGQEHAASSDAAPAGTAERKPLYYRNPMGLPDTSPTPKKDSMGMDYLPVYAEDAAAAGAAGEVAVSPGRVQAMGVRTAAVARVALDEGVRATGRIVPDERRLSRIAPKFEGYIERMHVNATGQAVQRGQATVEVYSPELVAAQREVVVAREGIQALRDADAEARASMERLLAASLQRLRNWDVPSADIDALLAGREPQRTLTLRAPATGIVLERKAVPGMRFMPGEVLFELADLSRVWVMADVPEQSLALVKVGQPVAVTVPAYADGTVEGRVTYVYPTLDATTRTVPVRIELPNPHGRWKPGLFAQVDWQAGGKAVLAVPASAVIDSGRRQVVVVQTAPGRFAPRDIQVGRRGREHIEVLDGVREGEQVVVAGQFLIDAESNLKAALASLSPASADTSAASPSAGAAAAGHRATGVIDALDAKALSAMITHQPVPSLKWPAMTMEFRFANAALMRGLAPGKALDFEFVERGAGEWVITAVHPAAAHATGH